jgi:glycosyltransferase involved in cell wall biosynthesis
MYDTHTLESDFIDADRLEEKISAVGAMAPLQICYAGRAADMKGPLDWLEVLALLRDEGVRFHATWLGDGPMLDRMRAVVEQRSLSANIDLAGFVSDRAKLLDRMKSSHIFLFCHKTPESPRCLIESLVCGTPIVGYGSAYARDIVAEHGGGQFADVGNVRQLADRLIALDRDRGALQAEIRRAARSGLRYDEQSLYRERARHIRAHL